MRNTAYHGSIRTDIGLLNKLLDFKISGKDFISNQESVKIIGKVVDLLKNKKKGHVLFSIVQGKTRKINLVIKRIEERSYYNGFAYSLYSWTKEEQVNKSFEAKIHDANFKRNLYTELYEIPYLTMQHAMQYCVTESIKGPTINTTRLKRLNSHMEKIEEPIPACIINEKDIPREYKDLKLLSDKFLKTHITEINRIVKVVDDYVSKLNNPMLQLVSDVNTDETITIGRIENVINWTDSERLYSIKMLTNSNGHLSIKEEYRRSNAGAVHTGYNKLGNNMYSSPLGTSVFMMYDTAENNALVARAIGSTFPIEFIDEGRYIAFINTSRLNSYKQEVVIGPDPKTHENHKELFEKCISDKLKEIAMKRISFDRSAIQDNDIYMNFSSYLESAKFLIQPILKTFKKMNDEYQFLAKKRKAEGEDIQITDNLKYNHEKGRVQYNDFSIEFNDEMMKSLLYEKFQGYLKEYYRGSISEQSILDNVLSLVFNSLESRLFARAKTEFTRHLIINDTINLEIQHKISGSGARLLYLNGTKFNGNEILKIIREITCYRNPEEANRFIKNVGKLGLSVYIGITSGYEVAMKDEDRVLATRIFKFKKLKGRSNYELLLDTTSIALNSKKLISVLYKKFIGDYIPTLESKIEKIIFENSESTMDYMKYKFLIDSSYDKYKENARKFLEKKVKDTESEFVKYYDIKNRKVLDAIKVIGLSGNVYLVAYNTNDSFVFLSPEVKNETENLYTGGRYICMIDESNIKSNIGYDTVVSKLMSLKNDSSVAHTIYNLEEELNG